MEDYWRNQHQSDHPPSVKIPKLLLEPPQASDEESVLPLFVPEPSCRISSNLSAFSDSTITTTTATSKISRMIGLFSLAQWQELELQALIFKYMLAGETVPTELLQPIKKSLLLKSPSLCYLNHPFQLYQHYQPAMLQSGYWGRSAVDPEPGRCRRTDGKKWRCSKDVVAGQKYCDRHMHRGRNRSRKPVEILTSTATTTTTTAAILPKTAVASGNHFTLTGPSPLMMDLHLNQSPRRRCPESEPTPRNRSLLHHNRDNNVHGEGKKPDGQVLRHFFDDWPKSQEEPNGVSSNASPTTTTSTSFLSISIQGMSNNPPSDFSLKLSTGIGDDDESSTQEQKNISRQQSPPNLNWGDQGWSAAAHRMSSMGGPLAEALRASTSNSSSPMSVLPNRSGSETSSVST